MCNVEKSEDDVGLILNLGNSELKNEMGWSFKGCVERQSMSTPALILAEDWPSWILILRGLGWTKFVVLVKNKLKFRNMWKSMSDINVSFHAWSELKTICLSLFKINVWIWIEGSEEFLNTLGVFVKGLVEGCDDKVEAKIVGISLIKDKALNPLYHFQ